MSGEILQRKMSRREMLGMASRGVALLGLASIAAACQTTIPQAPVTGQQVAVETTGQDAAPAEQVTIEYITPAALGLERTMYENFVLKFMQEEDSNVKINVSFEAWNDYMTKLPTMLAGGVVPDVIHQHMSIVQEYAYRGALAELNPLMERDNVKAEDYIPALFDAFSHKGKTYGIPKDNAAWGVYYNKAMFDEAGLDYPANDWTMEDFQTVALELTRDEGGRPASDSGFDPTTIKQWGFAWSDPGPTPAASEAWRGFVKAYGGDWYNEDYTETLLTSPEAIADLTMFHDMRCAQHSIPTSAEALGQGDPFRAGLTAMAVSFHIMTFFSKQENVRFEYDVTFMPSGPGGQYSVVGCSGWALPTEAKHKEEGWEFIKYLTSLPIQTYIGQQKRWGVALKEAVGTIEPDDGYPEHFALVHTDPFKGTSEVEVISMKFPPQQSRIRDVYASEFDPIWTCSSDDVATAAENAKGQIEAILAELNW